MVREWGMSDRIGPMAWGSQGAVFLGEDLMHTRDYSDETARVIDEEVERILRDEEDRCRKVLTEYRPGLDAVAQALLERETLEGEEVEDIVDKAMGRKVGGPRVDHPRRRHRGARVRAARLQRRGRHRPPTSEAPDRDRAQLAAEVSSARSSATAFQSSVALNAPRNEARTTPSRSATSVIGAAVDVVALVQRAVCGVLDLDDRDVVALERRSLVVQARARVARAPT